MFNGIEIGGSDPNLAPGSVATSKPLSAHETIPFEHRLMTKKEISQYFGVTERTIEVWMRRRYVPYLKIGGSVRFRVAMVVRYVDEKYLVPAGHPPRRRSRSNPGHRVHARPGPIEVVTHAPGDAADSARQVA